MKNPENEKYVKLGVTGIAVAVAAIAFSSVLASAPSIASFGNTILGILMPFIYGAVIAYLLAPLCNKIEALLAKRAPDFKGAGGVAIVGALLAALLVIVALLALVIPSVVESVVQIAQTLPGQIDAAVAWVDELLESNPELQAQWDETSANITASVNAWLQTDLLSSATSVAASLSGQITGLVSMVSNLFLGVMISVYLLGSRKKFARQAKMLVGGIFPARWAALIEEEVRYADRMFNGFLVGRIVDSAIVAVITFVFGFLCGFDSAVLVAVVVGVTNTIPVFGPYLGAIPSALILLLENPMHCLVFLVFIVIMQQVDGNVISPRILGETTGVSSFWVMFSVLFFGGLWGILGMIVGVPIFAVIYDIVRKLVYVGLRHHGREDLLPGGGE